jgi:uncharacterized protein with PIN domain
MGYDAVLSPAQPLSGLYQRAYNESRVIVTRNRRVKSSHLFRIIHVESQRLAEQLQQLMRELCLSLDSHLAFSRCDVCNVEVEPIDKPLVKDRVPAYVFHTQPLFRACPACRRIYWAATHWQRIKASFDRINRGEA